MIWIVLAGAVFNIMMALVTKTDNFQSSMFFKVIPFFLGMSVLLYVLMEMGIIVGGK